MKNPQSDRTIGPIIGSLIIVILLIIGALYFWGQKLNSEERAKARIEAAEEKQHDLEKKKADDLTSIQADLKATNVTPLSASSTIRSTKK